MSYSHPHHFAHAPQRACHEGEEWEPGGHASPYLYSVTSPPTTSQHWVQQTSPSMSSYPPGYYQPASQAASYGSSYVTHNNSYGGQQTLPPPQPSPHSRGLSRLGDYHYGRQVYELPSTVSTSPGWDPATGTSYGNYAFDTQAHSDGESSETRDPTPQSDIGTTPPSSSVPKSIKEKKWVCYRTVKSQTETCGKAFARKADLQRHEDCVHDKDKNKRISCSVKKCNRKGENGFLRKDHLTEHLRHFHSKDIPKKHRRSVSQVEDGEEEEDEHVSQLPEPPQVQFFN